MYCRIRLCGRLRCKTWCTSKVVFAMAPQRESPIAKIDGKVGRRTEGTPGYPDWRKNVMSKYSMYGDA